MTTRIHDPEQGFYRPTYVGLTATGNTVTVRAGNGLMSGTANGASNGLMAGTARGLMAGAAKVDRAEFLAAVATELDVIVIDKTTLPETHVGDGKVDFIYGEQGHVEPIPQGINADELIALGLALKANPPIDEAQVNALARLVAAETNGTHIAATALARRLIQAGVRMDGAR